MVDLGDKFKNWNGFIHERSENVPVELLWAHTQLMFLKNAVYESALDDCPCSGEIYEPMMLSILKNIESGLAELMETEAVSECTVVGFKDERLTAEGLAEKISYIHDRLELTKAALHGKNGTDGGAVTILDDAQGSLGWIRGNIVGQKGEPDNGEHTAD